MNNRRGRANTPFLIVEAEPKPLLEKTKHSKCSRVKFSLALIFIISFMLLGASFGGIFNFSGFSEPEVVKYMRNDISHNSTTVDPVTKPSSRKPLIELESVKEVKGPEHSQPNISAQLISDPLHFPVKVSSDVEGNLGHINVVLNDEKDWLKSRWQAASDMNGTPIPGKHWVDIKWEKSNKKEEVVLSLYRIVLDWETANCEDYEILVMNKDGESELVFEASTKRKDEFLEDQESGGKLQRARFGKHVVDKIDLKAQFDQRRAFDRIRLLLNRPATRWGSSLWHIQVWGRLN